MRAIFMKMRSGETLSEEEQQLAQEMRRRRDANAGAPRGRGRSSAVEAQLGGDYLVFALRKGSPVALRIRTGVTDMDHAEVVFGLDEDDEVLLLPSASLVRAQESFQRRISGRMGIPGLNRQSGGGRG